jgi:hypothetical protein
MFRSILGRTSAACVGVCLAVLAGGHAAHGQNSATNSVFSYQGSLKDAGSAYTGPATLEFRLFSALAGGELVAGPITRPVTVTEGLFTAVVDFGLIEPAAGNRWVEVAVSTGGPSQTLSPRQRLLASPVAGVADRSLTTDGLAFAASPMGSTVTFQPLNEVGVSRDSHWQAFQPNFSGSLTKLAIVRRDNAALSNIRLRIFVGSSPGGPLVHEQLVWLPGSGECVFNLVPPPLISSSNTYTWELSNPGLPIRLGISSTDVLPNLPSSAGGGDYAFRAIVGSIGNTLVAGDRVGMGVSIPLADLHVHGNSNQSTLRVSADTPSGAWLRIASTDPAGGRDWALISGGSNAPTGAGTLAFFDVESSTTAAVMTQQGRLGLGTINPVAPLHIEGNSDAAPSGGGLLVLGSPSSSNIAIDNNEILARSNGAVADLYLNPSAGRVAIGGPQPSQAQLHVQTGGNLSSNTGVPWAQYGFSTSTNMSFDPNEIQVRNNAAPASLFVQFQGGQVFIGDTANPVATTVLQINGNALKPGGGAWGALSDRTAKTDIAPLVGTLDRLLQLHGYSFRYTDQALAQGGALPGTQLGLMAQEVQQVFPDWVTTDDKGRLNVSERATTALMVEALRDLRAEKDAADQRAAAEIDSLKRDNADLKARLERLERALIDR